MNPFFLPVPSQTETNTQVELFALLTRLVQVARKSEDSQLPRVPPGATQHPSQIKVAHEALAKTSPALANGSRGSDSYAPAAAAIEPAAGAPLSPRALAARAASHLLQVTAAEASRPQALSWPNKPDGSRILPGGDPFMKPFSPAPSRAMQQGGSTAAIEASRICQPNRQAPRVGRPPNRVLSHNSAVCLPRERPLLPAALVARHRTRRPPRSRVPRRIPLRAHYRYSKHPPTQAPPWRHPLQCFHNTRKGSIHSRPSGSRLPHRFR